MKKYTLTTLFKLKHGDRFYFATDKNMKVHEVVSFEHEPVSVESNDKIHPKIFKTDKDVIYLRNSNE